VERSAVFGAQLREGIATTQEQEDVVTEDLLTEVLRGVDDLWFLESHLAE
jgi:DNA-binding ferritin-like protein